MIEKLKINLLQGKYKDAEKICEKMSINDIRDIITKGGMTVAIIAVSAPAIPASL